MEKKKKVEEYEEKIHSLMLETTDKFCIVNLEQNSKFQVCTNIKMHPIKLLFDI